MLSLASLPSPGAERRRQQRDAALVPGSRPLPSSGVAFEPTSTARLDETMRELGQFSPHVRSAMETALEHAASVEQLAARLRAEMAVPLPRVWAPVSGSPSQCEPKSPLGTHDYPSGRVGGGSVDDSAFVAAASEVVRQLRVNVAGPLERWLDALDVAAARLESVERARLGFDAARREAEERFAADERRAHVAFAALRDPTAAAAAVAAATGTTGGGGGFGGEETDQYGRGLLGRRRRGQHGLAPGHVGPAAGAAALFGTGGMAGGGAAASSVAPASARGSLFLEQAHAAELEEAALRRAQHERALQAIRASYEEQERLAFEMLSGLARDTARLKTYYAASLLSAMHGCQRLALALGPAKLPLPGFAPAGGPAASSDYGRIGSVEGDVLAASPLAKELARGCLPPTQAEAGAGVSPAQAAGAGAPPAWPVVVRRAVATPMAVGADTTLEARAPVPPPPQAMAAEEEVGITTPEPAPAAAAPLRRRMAAGLQEEERGGLVEGGVGETGESPASPAAALLLHRRPIGAGVEEEEEEERAAVAGVPAATAAETTTMAAPTMTRAAETTTAAAPTMAGAAETGATTTTMAAPTTATTTTEAAPAATTQLQPPQQEEPTEEEFAEARSHTWTPASSLMGSRAASEVAPATGGGGIGGGVGGVGDGVGGGAGAGHGGRA